MTRPGPLTLILGALAAGCGAGDDNGTVPPTLDASTKSDAGATGDASRPASDGATASTSFVRIAAWAPGAPPLDFCLGDLDSGSFFGPLLSTAFVGEGGAPAIPFLASSAYLPVPAGTFDARIVASGAGCDPGLGRDSPSVTLPPNQRSTLALEGRAAGSPSLRVVAMGDDLDVAGTSVALRFLNTDPAIDPVTLTVPETPTPVVVSAAFGAIPPTDAGLDPHGYAVIPPLSAMVLSLTDAGADAGLFATPTVTASGGTVITLVFVPTDGTDASTNGQPVLVECIDNAGTVDLFSNCDALP